MFAGLHVVTSRDNSWLRCRLSSSSKYIPAAKDYRNGAPVEPRAVWTGVDGPRLACQGDSQSIRKHRERKCLICNMRSVDFTFQRHQRTLCNSPTLVECGGPDSLPGGCNMMLQSLASGTCQRLGKIRICASTRAARLGVKSRCLLVEHRRHRRPLVAALIISWNPHDLELKLIFAQYYSHLGATETTKVRTTI